MADEAREVDESLAMSTCAATRTLASDTIESAQRQQRGACDVSFSHPCFLDVASRRVFLRSLALVAVVLGMLAVCCAVSK